MQRSKRELVSLCARAGFVTDVYFDDFRWVVRYVVVDTGHSMPQREVLIDPAAEEAEARATAQPAPAAG